MFSIFMVKLIKQVLFTVLKALNKLFFSDSIIDSRQVYVFSCDHFLTYEDQRIYALLKWNVF